MLKHYNGRPHVLYNGGVYEFEGTWDDARRAYGAETEPGLSNAEVAAMGGVRGKMGAGLSQPTPSSFVSSAPPSTIAPPSPAPSSPALLPTLSPSLQLSLPTHQVAPGLTRWDLAPDWMKPPQPAPAFNVAELVAGIRDAVQPWLATPAPAVGNTGPASVTVAWPQPPQWMIYAGAAVIGLLILLALSD